MRCPRCDRDAPAPDRVLRRVRGAAPAARRGAAAAARRAARRSIAAGPAGARAERDGGRRPPAAPRRAPRHRVGGGPRGSRRAARPRARRAASDRTGISARSPPRPSPSPCPGRVAARGRGAPGARGARSDACPSRRWTRSRSTSRAPRAGAASPPGRSTACRSPRRAVALGWTSRARGGERRAGQRRPASTDLLDLLARERVIALSVIGRRRALARGLRDPRARARPARRSGSGSSGCASSGRTARAPSPTRSAVRSALALLSAGAPRARVPARALHAHRACAARPPRADVGREGSLTLGLGGPRTDACPRISPRSSSRKERCPPTSSSARSRASARRAARSTRRSSSSARSRRSRSPSISPARPSCRPRRPSAWGAGDARARRVFPSRVAERHGLAPFALDGRELSLVATYPVDLGLLDEISFMLSLHLTAHVGPEWRVRELIHRVYGSPLPPRLAALAGRPRGAAPAGTPRRTPRRSRPPAEARRPPPTAAAIAGFARDEDEPLEPLAAALAQALESVEHPARRREGAGRAARGGARRGAAAELDEEPAPEEPPAALDRTAPPRWTLDDARAAVGAARHRDEVVLVGAPVRARLLRVRGDVRGHARRGRGPRRARGGGGARPRPHRRDLVERSRHLQDRDRRRRARTSGRSPRAPPGPTPCCTASRAPRGPSSSTR